MGMRSTELYWRPKHNAGRRGITERLGGAVRKRHPMHDKRLEG